MKIWLDSYPITSWVREPYSDFTPEAINEALEQLNLLEDYDSPTVAKRTDPADLRTTTESCDTGNLQQSIGDGD